MCARPHPTPRRRARAPRGLLWGLWAFHLGCSAVPPPETVNRDPQSGGYPAPGQAGHGGGTPGGPPQVGWGASENDAVIPPRYVQGIQVGVVVGPMGGRAGDCNCRVPGADGQTFYDDPGQADPNLPTAQPAYRDGTAAQMEGDADALEGTAAWFGAEMLSTPTTSGAERSQWGVFASHPTLAYGTEVEVTNVKNKRTARVVINDRTGVNDRRVLLLSEGTATALDMKRHGVIPVKLRVIGQR